MKPVTLSEQAAVNALITAAEDALSVGDVGQVFELCERIDALSPGHIESQFLAAEAHHLLGDDTRAEVLYRSVVEVDAGYSEAWGGIAALRFAALDFDAAHAAAIQAIRADPSGGLGWWWRGMVREQRGDFMGADRDHRRASILMPVGFPWAVPLTDAMIESMVQLAVGSMHPSIQDTLGQVAFFVEEVPNRDALIDFDPIPAPHEILGFFQGIPLSERNPSDPVPALPAAITLYRRNLQRAATDREELLHELRITVLHELGHYLGLSEEDLAARGLD